MRTLRAVAAAFLTIALLSACGGEDTENDAADPAAESSTPTSESPSESTSSQTPTTAATETVPTAPTDSPGDVTQAELDAALLTPTEVGPGFVLGTNDDSDTPLPCDPGGTPVDVAVPPALSGGTTIEHSSGQAALKEEISIYASETLASQAFSLGTAGLSCREGTLPDGSTVVLSPASNVTDQVDDGRGVGTSTLWSFRGEGFEGVLVATLAGRVLLTTQFQAVSGFDASVLPQPIDITARAFAKALAN